MTTLGVKYFFNQHFLAQHMFTNSTWIHILCQPNSTSTQWEWAGILACLSLNAFVWLYLSFASFDGGKMKSSLEHFAKFEKTKKYSKYSPLPIFLTESTCPIIKTITIFIKIRRNCLHKANMIQIKSISTYFIKQILVKHPTKWNKKHHPRQKATSDTTAEITKTNPIY